MRKGLHEQALVSTGAIEVNKVEFIRFSLQKTARTSCTMKCFLSSHLKYVVGTTHEVL